MKTIKWIAFLLLVVIAGSGIAWYLVPEVRQQAQPLIAQWLPMQAPRESTIEHAKKHADPNYVCPMHPQIVKDEPGSCPICGMDLVAKEQPKRESIIEHAKKHADPNYVCPMHPQIVKGEPGTCPICGMDLVLSESGSGSTDDGELPAIDISSSAIQQMGIVVQDVEKRRLDSMIRTVGRIAYNEESLQHVHARSSGWVERVHVRAVGESVEKGAPLLEFYSPEIDAAEKDLLIASQSGALYSRQERGSLLESAKQKLRLLDVRDNAIERVLKTGKSSARTRLYAGQSGTVTAMGIRDGMYITPEMELYTIADLSSVWVLVDVFEEQMARVKTGQQAVMQVQGAPGKEWRGKVDYIYPELDPVTRTLTVRLVFKNPDLALKPNMFADISIVNKGDSEVLAVPADALIYYEDSTRVVIETGEGKYQPVEVATGRKSAGYVEVLKGLEECDRVVVSGQFMIDSESNLQASFRRMAQ